MVYSFYSFVSDKETSNFNQIRLAIIIGIIVIILWPLIRSIKLGTSTVEIEKVSYVEDKEQIYLSWIKADKILLRNNSERQVGAAGKLQDLNVAISRSKEKLIIIRNFDMMLNGWISLPVQISYGQKSPARN
jgi:hypothetical protein